MMSLFATIANACAQLFYLWLGVLPAVIAVLLVHSLARYYSFLWAPPPTLAPHRGRQQPTAHTPIHGPFHPEAPRVQSPPSFHLLPWIIDSVIKSTMDLAWLATNTIYLFAGKVNYTFSKPNLETYVAPIRVRVQRGIAQVPVPTIPNVLTLTDIPYRYICPAFFLLVLLAVLALTTGVSAKLTFWVCFVGYATAVAGDRMGVVEEEEDVALGGDPVPPISAGLTAAPHGQT